MWNWLWTNYNSNTEHVTRMGRKWTSRGLRYFRRWLHRLIFVVRIHLLSVTVFFKLDLLTRENKRISPNLLHNTMVQKKTVETKDEHPPYFCVSKLSVLVLVSCDTLKIVSSPSQPVGWSLGRLATLWVMCLRLGLWPNALQHTDINSTDGFICFGTPCVHC